MTFTTRLRALLSASWLHIVFLFIIGLTVIIGHRPDQRSITHDRAYLVYMAQAMQRGEPVYQTTTFGYTPLGPLVSSGMMRVGSWFGLPSYLAPRLLSVPFFALTGVLLYLIIKQLTGNTWLALWGGLLNFGFESMILIHAANLEPKLLIQVFGLLLILALQQRWWLLAGIAVSGAAMNWQPGAIIFVAPLLMGLAHWRKPNWKSVKLFLVGVGLGLLPAIMYLTITAQWYDFLYQSAYLKLIATSSSGGIQAIEVNWFESVLFENLPGINILLVPLSLIGIADYLWQARLASKKEERLLHILNPQSGGILLITLAWLAYNTFADVIKLEVQGTADFLGFHYLIAFWSAWGIFSIYRIMSYPLARLPLNRSPALLSILTAVIIFGLVRSLPSESVDFTLQEQHERAQHILAVSDDFQDSIAINIIEFYVMVDQPTPWSIIRFANAFNKHIIHRQPQGCQTFIDDLEQSDYKRIVIGSKPGNDCLQTIQTYLQENPNRYKTMLTVDRRLEIQAEVSGLE